MAGAAMTAEQSRPGAVTAAVVLMLLAAGMMAVGGVLTAAISFDALRQIAPASVPDEKVRASLWLYRGVGLLFAAAALGVLALTAGAARRDPRSRRAAVALGLALVVLVSLVAILVGTQLLALLSLLPLIVGIVLLTRPEARIWFAGAPEAGDV